MLKLAIFGLIFSSVGLLVWQYSPAWALMMKDYEDKKVKDSARKLDNMFLRIPARKLFLMHTLTPLGLGGVAFLVSGEIFIGLIAAAFGLVLPAIIIKRADINRKKKFNKQLVDALMILSSALKGGLSLLQAFEALVEDMPAPISQEFTLVLRENKMGIPLDVSLDKLNKRMQSNELNLIVTAISVARETGGNLTKIFRQLVNSIRQKSKIMAKVATLTVQGKLQGLVLSLLPVGFCVVVYSINPKFFNGMLQDPTGRMLLGYAFISEIIGAFLIIRLSKVEV